MILQLSLSHHSPKVTNIPPSSAVTTFYYPELNEASYHKFRVMYGNGDDEWTGHSSATSYSHAISSKCSTCQAISSKCSTCQANALTVQYNLGGKEGIREVWCRSLVGDLEQDWDTGE